MGLYSSFYASLSGLATNASALSVIGNNLANLNTAGFKGSSSEFQDLFAAAIANQGTQGNGNPMQVGLGASLGSVATNFAQGSFQQTGNVTDMAMQGNGFFTLQNKQGSAVYTRNGNFTIDKSGFLVDSQGNKVMGWNATNGVVNPGGLPGPIQLNMAGTSGGVATRTVQIIANLNSASATTSTFTSTVQIYDSLGATHSLTLSFQPTGTAGQWAVTAPATVDGAAVGGVPAYIQFDNTGALTGFIPAGGAATATPTAITGNNNPSITFTGFTNGAAPVSAQWALATPNATGSGFTAYLTSYASASTTSGTSQDGYGAGTVDSLTVDQNGVIIGNYTNGQTIPMAQVAVSTFLNDNGLSKQGGNNWIATVASGTAAVGAANQGGRGGVLGSNLELSNVDVATELTRMIINQNGYQANSRVVTTANTLLQEVLNLVR
ncbi:MAG TPA: flagellar hook protein FlgE [Holophaga sp.]|nr:flagellar hook protein FlgE [Holophaga sp.]